MITSFHPIDPSDVPELVRVHSAAFKTDQFSNFMLNGKPPGTHESLMERAIQSWISDPTSRIFKAVNEDGIIVGWACWLTKEKQPISDKPVPKSTLPPNDKPEAPNSGYRPADA